MEADGWRQGDKQNCCVTTSKTEMSIRETDGDDPCGKGKDEIALKMTFLPLHASFLSSEPIDLHDFSLPRLTSDFQNDFGLPK